jgi:hypothetical protein
MSSRQPTASPSACAATCEHQLGFDGQVDLAGVGIRRAKRLRGRQSRQPPNQLASVTPPRLASRGGVIRSVRTRSVYPKQPFTATSGTVTPPALTTELAKTQKNIEIVELPSGVYHRQTIIRRPSAMLLQIGSGAPRGDDAGIIGSAA